MLWMRDGTVSPVQVYDRNEVNLIPGLNQDPRENLIRQWLAVDTSLGETAKELQLSQNPPLGTWKIMATVNVS